MDIEITFGPPGTGKTSYLLQVLEREMRSHGTEEIAYVSFTKEGANQGRRRAFSELSVDEESVPYFRTLHSIAFRSLRMRRSQVISKRDYRLFSDKMGMKFTGYYTEDFRHNDDLYLFFNILHRNNPRTASNYLYVLDIDILRHVTRNYREFKEYYRIYDYTDMIELFNKENRALPVKVAIIDEAQDLTTLQWNMIWVAFRDCERVYIAGDDDQAIYEWSGADVNYFLGLDGSVNILRKSYRLPKNILEFSKRITRLIGHRVDKDYEGLDEMGEVTEVNSLEEIEITEDEAWLFLSRNRYFLEFVKVFIKNKGLLYTNRGKLSIDHKEVEAIKLFERVRKTREMSKADETSLRYHRVRPDFDLGLPWYDNFDWDTGRINYYRDIIANRTDLGRCNIRIDTIHSVKGGEADNVVVLLDITRQVYLNTIHNPDSEHRVFYVACTRAKKRLFVVHGDYRYQYQIYEE